MLWYCKCISLGTLFVEIIWRLIWSWVSPERSCLCFWYWLRYYQPATQITFFSVRFFWLLTCMKSSLWLYILMEDLFILYLVVFFFSPCAGSLFLIYVYTENVDLWAPSLMLESPIKFSSIDGSWFYFLSFMKGDPEQLLKKKLGVTKIWQMPWERMIGYRSAYLAMIDCLFHFFVS